MTSLGDTIKCFKTPIVIKRAAAATTFVNGLAQATSRTSINVPDASVQPVSGNERLLLPEGIRDREIVKIYAKCEIRGIDVAGPTKADKIEHDGKTYVVQTVVDWSQHIKGNYYKAICVKEE